MVGKKDALRTLREASSRSLRFPVGLVAKRARVSAARKVVDEEEDELMLPRKEIRGNM